MSDYTIRDMVGNELRVGDCVVYGRSNRNNPINIGIIEDFRDIYSPSTSYFCDIIIKGLGNTKLATIPNFHSGRMVLLPDGYKGCLDE
jgi:hypothetical protein